MNNPPGQARFRESVPQGLPHVDRKLLPKRRQFAQLLPVAGWIAQIADRQVTQPTVLRRQHKRQSAFFQCFPVACQDRIANVCHITRQAVLAHSQGSAGRKPHQIIRAGHWAGFIKVINSPNQAALAIAPGPEVFDMKIAHSEHQRRVRQLRTDLGPQLHPAVKGGPKEGERAFRHPLMFDKQIGFEAEQAREIASQLMGVSAPDHQ